MISIHRKLFIRNFKDLKRIMKYHHLSYIHNPGTECLRPLTLGKLLEESANKFGDRLAIISRAQGQQLTFQEVLHRADRFAAGLRNVGLDQGDRVGIWAPNLIEWYLTHMACARGGYVLVNINPAFQPSEIEYCINKVGIKCIVTSSKFKTQDFYGFLNKISPEISASKSGKLQSKRMPTLESIIVVTKEHLGGAFRFDDIYDFASSTSLQNIHNTQDLIDSDQPCHIQFTSGTTGKPKAAIQSHFHLVNNSFFIGKRNELDRKQHRICVQVPFFHVYGTDITICAATNHGATLVLPAPGYNPDASLDAIKEEKCTVIHGTPTMYVDLVNKQKMRREDIYPEIAVTGGASCSPHLFKEMKKVLKLKKTKSVYGLTETTAVIFQSLYDDDEYQSTSTVGYIGEHLEAKVVNSEGLIVPRGVPGELCVRGYCTTLGYWQDELKTKELISEDKWLRTGDQFIIDENGYGKLVGRLKELIIRGGENIFPGEVEDFLNTHPNIIETHVVGLPHERLGEEVCACIRASKPVTAEDIKAFCKGKIAHYKIPSVIVILDSFPKTTSGKIQKYKLVEHIKNTL